MKMLAFLVVIILQCFALKAQIVFRNVGPDTLRIAIGTFYDSTSKGVKQKAFHKAIITRGWYRLYPGDSVVAGDLFGPAVYYLPHRIANNQMIVGDTVPAQSSNLRANYRESLFTLERGLTDTTKFRIKHPYTARNDANRRTIVVNFFRVVMVPEQARKEGRLVIEIGRPPRKG